MSVQSEDTCPTVGPAVQWQWEERQLLERVAGVAVPQETARFLLECMGDREVPGKESRYGDLLITDHELQRAHKGFQESGRGGSEEQNRA